MKKTVRRPRPSLMLLLLTCALIVSGCAGNGRAVKPSVCPKPAQPPSNVMRPPSAEQSLRRLLFESEPRQIPSLPPAKP